MRAIPVNDALAWNKLAESFGAHPLQEWQWGELKAATGPWTAMRLKVEDESGIVLGGAQVLVRSMPFPFKAIAYAPRGPFAKSENLMTVADQVAAWCKGFTKAQSLKIDPAVQELSWTPGWVESETSLINKTAVIDLVADEDALMKGIPNRKCRQYIRKGQRDGVVVRAATRSDLPAIMGLYRHTAEVDGFNIHVDEFYYKAFDLLDGIEQVFVAQKDDQIQAFLWNAVSRGGTAFELWGAVSDAGKRSRANYYMKWVAILAAKEAGARVYDLNGLLNDGISDFKLLFVPEPTYWVTTHDKPLRPLYGVMNRALAFHRQRNEENNAQEDTSRN